MLNRDPKKNGMALIKPLLKRKFSNTKRLVIDGVYLAMAAAAPVSVSVSLIVKAATVISSLTIICAVYYHLHAFPDVSNLIRVLGVSDDFIRHLGAYVVHIRLILIAVPLPLTPENISLLQWVLSHTQGTISLLELYFEGVTGVMVTVGPNDPQYADLVRVHNELTAICGSMIDLYRQYEGMLGISLENSVLSLRSYE